MANSDARRQQLYNLLGDLPDRDRPISARLLTVEEREAYVLETLVLDLNGIEGVPAYFSYPRAGGGPFPTVLYNHAHGGEYEVGKREFIEGRGGIQRPPYAEALAREGYAGLCLDTWNFGERSGRSESFLFKWMLWNGQVLWGMMVYDNLRAVDYLTSRPDVDAGRLATLGISMGSTMAWWTAALDTRVKVCVDICCLTDFESLLAARGLDEHGVYYYVPSLVKHFTTAQINALIAPRPHLSLAGNHDRLTPPAGLDRVDMELRQVYEALGAGDAWKLKRYETGHFETAHMRLEIMTFLQKWL